FDSRIKAAETIEKMNQELQDAGVTLTEPCGGTQERVGFLSEPETFPVSGDSDVMAFTLGIYTRRREFDHSVIIYSRTQQRLVVINADPSLGEFSWYPSEVSVGPPDTQSKRMIGTGWYSSCDTGFLTKARLKLDAVQQGRTTNLLSLTREARGHLFGVQI